MIISTLVVLYLCYANIGAVYKGQNCIVPRTNQKGQYINLEQCDYAKKLLQKNLKSKTCGFAGLVCCPIAQNVAASKPGTLSQQKCTRYYNKGHRGLSVDLSEKEEFPHMAAVGYGDSSIKSMWLCGGSLISHHFVMSAAHCAHSLDFGAAKWVRLRNLDLKDTREDAKPLNLRIAQIYAHPKYKRSSHYHDIALFRLEHFVAFGDNIKAACLNPEKNLPVNILQATGWSQVDLFGDRSNHLRKVDLNIVDHGTCARKYSDVSVRRLEKGILDEYQMCAGDALGKDTCLGDSGGPLHYLINETDQVFQHFYVAGITSFGKGCGGENSIAVYTRVSSYLGWIESVVWQGNYN